MFTSKRLNRRLSFFVLLAGSILISFIAVGPANAATKPDFCYAINPGGSDVEITFFPSKLNITEGDGADNADFYRIIRSDGRTWDIQRFENKNIHDYDAKGTNHSYEVVSIGKSNSNPEQCIEYRVVSSIAPGRLKDWRRPNAGVYHGLGNGALGTSERYFGGQDNDLVTTSVSSVENRTLNPDGGQFAFQAAVTLWDTELAVLSDTPNPSWNVMQRGFANSAGGQWKMSLVMAGQPNKLPRAQCAMQDGDGHVKRVNSTYVLQPGVKATITCVIDDKDDTIRVIVNGRTDAAASAPVGFGDVDPYHAGSSCWQKVARTIAIGNKPLCISEKTKTLTPDDRFRGRIQNVRILKQ